MLGSLAVSAVVLVVPYFIERSGLALAPATGYRHSIAYQHGGGSHRTL
jgi:hypothetical protein